MGDNKYRWVDFYTEFAQKLLAYKLDRRALIEKVKLIYSITGLNMPTLEKDNRLVDIDPFTVFGLFNKSSMKAEKRIKILSAIAELFDIRVEVPVTFDSIPLLNNQNATFYWFIGYRAEHDIDDLWNLFESALKYAHDPSYENRQSLSKHFDIAINIKGNANSKITMALYWIAPHAFLNLDQRNTWYIYESGKLPEDFVATLPVFEGKIPAYKYFDIVEKLHAFLNSQQSSIKSFMELSFEAWRYSEEINQMKKSQTTQSQRDDKGTALADEDVDTVHYWLYAPGDGAYKWDEFYEKGILGIGWHEIGDLRQYATKDDMKMAMKERIDPSRPFKNAAHATWQFLHEMKPGDIVFAKKGMYQIVGRGVVTSEYYYDPTVDDHYPNLRKVRWTDKGEWSHPGQAAVKTLTDITPYTDYVEKLTALFAESEEDVRIEEPEASYPAYDSESFLEEVFMDAKSYKTLVNLVRTKKNVILQGAPGVGKTFAAKRLAYSMMGLKDPERVLMIQFHQNYSYEDFIEGFRPAAAGNGFEIRKGSFYNFCKKAAEDFENEYFFIIDEINRGNISKIFGELFMLIENDKRGNALQLLYSDEKFFVPKNLYIIGMMNTADRSLALLDYALRRRFAFYEMKPGFLTDGFREYRMQKMNEKFDRLITCVENLNDIIAADDSLGEGFLIGHSYFCNLSEIDDEVLSNIVEYELIPLLKEYWFDEPQKVKDWANKLRSAIL